LKSSDPSLKNHNNPVRSGWLDGLTRNVFVLGVVSLFTDISSEMIVPVRLLFLIIVLNTPLTLAALIEGLAESASSLIKIISGRLADRLQKRKKLILTGYGLSNLAKPLLALAGSWPTAMSLIFLDRAGKGIRSSPRDALIADSTLPAYRGKAFGFHRALDTLGAAIGPLITFGILAFSSNNLSLVFAFTAIPGALSLLVLIYFLKEKSTTELNPNRPDKTVPVLPGAKSSELAWWRQCRDLGPRFWMFTSVTTIFALGNSSDAFIFLRTEGLEHSLAAVPLIYFGYNLVYAALATPLGALSDRWGRLPVLIAGYLAFTLVYVGWAAASQGWEPWLLFLIYGIYAAATEGVSKAYVSDLIPRSQRGTGLGWFNGLTGLSALPANIMGGWLWANFGPGATFILGADLGLIAAVLLVVWSPWLSGHRSLSGPVRQERTH
jgi:MFS family permease